MAEMIIQTLQLTRKYGDRISVNRLNMQVKEGEIYGFLGPNGAGKTTTIRMLLNLIKPTSGEVRIFNKELKQNRLEILRQIGSLVESPSYYGHLTGYENLEVIRRLLEAPVNRIHQVLDIVRLTESANRLVKEYSLGMKQRLGIAAALLGMPKLLILDEPTNGLDPAGIQEIRELIKNLPKEYGMTILVSSHLLSEIDQMATQVGIIHKGKMIFQNSIETLREQSGARLKIVIDSPQYAVQFLHKQGISAKVEDEAIWLPQTNHDQAADINISLIQAGFRVSRLEEVKLSLEDIFLELTGKGESL
ncbi:ABC transporter ATP-binding protein [Thermoflavimicrobium daqui]|uniref:Bacitracin ABC transporter ATP-binding protein n=1 Tax=Thermoflavimicrobium daqui TaxID=2137476 RepID=A0A364K3M5_9BACL|nr:ABC transporter ATP-binding protein [Thermoflavimicrobium daqui]RAL23423.1 bacitracin ABC transporter ATP-binding protein [Thermoflavimicrobium daqui]